VLCIWQMWLKITMKLYLRIVAVNGRQCIFTDVATDRWLCRGSDSRVDEPEPRNQHIWRLWHCQRPVGSIYQGVVAGRFSSLRRQTARWWVITVCVQNQHWLLLFLLMTKHSCCRHYNCFLPRVCSLSSAVSSNMNRLSYQIWQT